MVRIWAQKAQIASDPSPMSNGHRVALFSDPIFPFWWRHDNKNGNTRSATLHSSSTDYMHQIYAIPRFDSCYIELKSARIIPASVLNPPKTRNCRQAFAPPIPPPKGQCPFAWTTFKKGASLTSILLEAKSIVGYVLESRPATIFDPG